VPDIEVCVSDEELEAERVLDPYNSTDGYLECICIYRKIALELPRFDAMVFHASVVSVDGMAYAFAAHSGTGKSTHTAFWRETFKDRCKMINDDKPIIRISHEPAIFGTPWDGKHHISNNIKSNLNYICILHRGEKNRVEKIEKNRAFGMILQQTYRPSSPQQMSKLLVLIDKLLSSVPVFNIWCNLDKTSACEIHNLLKGN
jgi:hypothetical protein